MKKIYAFTLDGEECPSSKFRYNLRLIAYLLYDIIYNYDGEYSTALIINDKIKYNSIHEGKSSSEYYLEYDEYNEKYINYEPFLIGNRSFAFTIDDLVMNEDVIRSLMEEVLLLVNVNYSYTINTICYGSKDYNDEKNRKKAVLELRSRLEQNIQKKTNLVKKKVMIMPLFKKGVGLF